MCLVERMCAAEQKDPDRCRALLSIICRQLLRMEIICPSTLEKTSVIRQEFTQLFNQMWDHAASSISSPMSLTAAEDPIDPGCPLLPLGLNLSDLFQPSRFAHEFFIDSKIGAGAFGSVLKVRNKLDNNLYAIKKIKMKRLSPESKVLREVTTLAKLDHPNVIRYHAAWLEYSRHSSEAPCGPACRKFPSTTSSEAQVKARAKHNNGSTANEEEEQFSDDDLFSASAVSKMSTQSSAAQSESQSRSVLSVTEASDVSHDGPSSGHCTDTFITLYIQMQLCEYALNDWLSLRDTSSMDVLHAEALHVFHQVVSGVHYIHSMRLIHRDIKPRNIFLRTSVGNRPVVKIGDFGLAREAAEMVVVESEAPSANTGDTHTSGVGTEAYAAPEQLTGGALTEKSDIFPLGMLLFELLCVFSTAMERAISFDELRQRKLPSQLVRDFPKESAYILWLTAPLPKDRPAAVDILQGESRLFDSDALAQNHVLHLEQQLTAAEAMLRAKDKEIEALSAKISQLSSVP